jgi:hypothetical protein
VQIANRCAHWKISSGVENFVLQALQIQGTAISVIDSLCRLGADRIENAASKSDSIVACVHCLAMALVLLRVTQSLLSSGCVSGPLIL